MKFNLKNRPKLYGDRGDKRTIEEWFEGFEKELRELQQRWDKDQQMFECCYGNLTQLRKEILGE